METLHSWPNQNRTLRQSKAPTPVQVSRQKDKVSEQKTQQMADAAYRRAYLHAQVAIARQQAKADAMKDAGIKPQEQQQQPKPKPLAKAPKSGRKPQNRKPPKR